MAAAGGATGKRGPSGAIPAAEQNAKRVRAESQQDNDTMLASSAAQQQPIPSIAGAVADSDGAVDVSDQQAGAGQDAIQELPAPVPAPLYKRPKPRARPAAASTGQ